MKKIALFLVLILVLCSAGCGGSENVAKSISTPANIDGFQRADFDKFNSPASENGLGGTKIYIDGVLEDVYILDGTDTLYGTVNSNGNKWIIDISLEGDKFLKEAELLEGSIVRIFCVYNGFSSVKKMPSVHFIKMVKIDTLESFHILEFTSEHSIYYEAYIDGVVNSAKELNPKDNNTKNNDSSDDITLNSFINKVETKSGISLHYLNKTVVDDVTAHIYTVNDDIFINVTENNKTNKITNVSLYFKIGINQNLYSNVVQSFDTSVSNEDEAVDILAEIYDSMGGEISIGVYEKNGFRYLLNQLDDGTTCISISKD